MKQIGVGLFFIALNMATSFSKDVEPPNLCTQNIQKELARRASTHGVYNTLSHLTVPVGTSSPCWTRSAAKMNGYEVLENALPANNGAPCPIHKPGETQMLQPAYVFQSCAVGDKNYSIDCLADLEKQIVSSTSPGCAEIRYVMGANGDKPPENAEGQDTLKVWHDAYQGAVAQCASDISRTYAENRYNLKDYDCDAAKILDDITLPDLGKDGITNCKFITATSLTDTENGKAMVDRPQYSTISVKIPGSCSFPKVTGVVETRICSAPIVCDVKGVKTEFTSFCPQTYCGRPSTASATLCLSDQTYSGEVTTIDRGSKQPVHTKLKKAGSL